MRPDLPWNVAGIPSEAREAARAAARREGLSIGEWLTRRIVSGLSEMSAPQETQREEWNGSYRSEAREAASRRDSDEMLDRVARSETETAGIYRRIEEQLRNVGRRLDASERSQTESNRVMSKAAVEMNIAAREQAQAFDQLGSHVVNLSERVERVEHRDGSEGLRDAVKALHQGLSRLADQISETANQSATQISALAGNVETVGGRLGQARHDFQAATQALENRIATLDERVRTVEKAAQSNTASLEHALETLEARQTVRKDDAAGTVAHLAETVSRLEARTTDTTIERRLTGIERALSDIVGRIDHDEEKPETVEDGLKKLAQRLDAAEASQREALADLHKAITDNAATKAAVEPPPSLAVLPFASQPAPFAAAPLASPPFSPLPAFDAPPFADPQPPFVDTSFVPPPAYDTAAPADQQFSPGQGYRVDAVAPPPTVDSYLSAARRSAQAASAAEAERAGAFTGFRWGTASPAKAAAAPRSGHTRSLIIGVLLLIAIAVVAGVILSRRAGDALPNSAIGAMFQNKAPALKPEPEEFSIKEQAAAAKQQTAPAKQIAPAPQQLAPAPQQVNPAPTQNVPATVPGSPVLAPQKSASAPPHAIVQAKAASLPPAKTVSPPPTKTASLPKAVSLPPLAVKAVLTPPPTPQAAPVDRLTAQANAGNPKAELIVGLKYLDGEGVPANDKQAAMWLERAAQAGMAVAQYRLGTMYERGRGVPADAAKATQWYQAAANQGNRKAMHNLAVAYAEGSGVKKDFAEASRWFSRAANLGLSDSQFNLAVLYERGLGVPQSLLDAYKWYAIAAAQGDTESKSRIAAISAQLSADARAAAQHAADTFRPGPLDARANVAPTIAELTRG